MHRLLKRQLKRFWGDSYSIPEEWKSLVATISSAYEGFEADREMLERSLELVSQELVQNNQQLSARNKELESTHDELQKSKDQLEMRVEERTADFKRANHQLVAEVAERRRAERVLQERELQLKKQQSVLIELAKIKILTKVDLKLALQKITEASSLTLAVARVSVWVYNTDRSKIKCLNLYELDQNRHLDSFELSIGETPNYFKAIEEKECIVVDDAQTDPMTKELFGNYLSPQRIKSLLDVPIRTGGQTVGLVSHEHVDEVRRWSIEDQNFALAIADIVSLIMEQDRRMRVEETLRDSLAQLSKKNRYETIISTVTKSVHKSINLQEVLENAVDAVGKNVEGVDNISIYMAEGEEAVLQAHNGYPDWFIKRVGRIPYPKGFTWKTIIEGKFTYCADTDQDAVMGPAGKELGTKSYVAIPIHFQGKTVGVININSLRKNAFDDEDLSLLEMVAQQIEIAINNAGQAESLRKSQVELTIKAEELSRSNVELAKEIMRRKRTEEQLEKQNRRLEEAYVKLEQQSIQLIQTEKLSTVGTMAAGVAHELNNPMMGMLNFIQYCIKHTDAEDRRYRVLKDTEDETKRCIDIVNSLLTFAPMEKDGSEAFEIISCEKIFRRVFNLLSYRIEKEGVEVRQNVEEGTPEIFARPNNIQQVFLNLTINALDALNGCEKKEIHIHMGRRGEFVQIMIADTGAGIFPDHLKKIFDPFFTTKPVGQGTGLGLSICRNIVGIHGGQISCESQVGSGTKFKVLLPVKNELERSLENV